MALMADQDVAITSVHDLMRIPDQLAYYFAGFMPNYGTARIFIDMVHDGEPWHEIRVFIHSLARGNAKRYVETFDWASGEQKMIAEITAWQASMLLRSYKLS